MKHFFLSFFFISLLSCSLEKDKKTTQPEEAIVPQNFKYEVVSEQKARGIKITNLKFDTLDHNDTKGLWVAFDVIASSTAFDSILPKGYKSFFIDIRCTSDEGKAYAYRTEVFKAANKKKFIHKQKDNFISSPTDRNLEISFPYRLLEMSEGNHNLKVDIEIFPAKFMDDSSSLNVQQLHSIAATPYASVSLKLNVRAPRLYKTTFTVHGFKLNTKLVKPDKFDMGVSGYPDLFWEVYCGNDYLYYSPYLKNKVEYLKTYSCPTFYCTKDDVVNLAFIDYDNGPFNTQDDIIEKYTRKVSALPANKLDTLHFGNLEYLVLETKVE